MTAPTASIKAKPSADGFAVKAYQQGVQRLVAACDSELLGSTHREGKFKLDVPPSFYDGLRVDAEGLGSYLRSATVANLVGKRSVDVAVALGLVDPAHVLVVSGVPHAQFLVMDLSQ
ncbi:MAG: uncharacterized protein QOJ26_1270 [Thermoplasmata archaeon]|jgi:hypothetical protein|nr:uncharacterized protein [Thermoplasmata archaeon]MEA3166398.1 uncharacterized protein [Thermoplasmata archaeon]